jgi:hypothetical protein
MSSTPDWDHITRYLVGDDKVTMLIPPNLVHYNKIRFNSTGGTVKRIEITTYKSYLYYRWARKNIRGVGYYWRTNKQDPGMS